MLVGTTAKSPEGLIEVAVLVGGVEQPLYRRQWDGKHFVVGTPGQAYKLKVKNLTTSGRILVVNTVDGRSTLDDKEGDFDNNRGLIIGALQATEFDGWRISNDEVNEFIFGSPSSTERTIAAQATGSTENIGVFGFAAFRERSHFALRGGGLLGGDDIFGGYRSKSFSADSYDDFGGGEQLRGGSLEGMGATTRGSIGTEMGDTRDSRVVESKFNRDPYASADILAIGYDTEDVLRSRGIIAPAEPNPFPGVGKTGYAKYQKTTR